MKKFYLFAIAFILTSVGGFATTWYSQGTGDPSSLSNWNSLSGGGGSTPSDFVTSGDIFIMQTSMSGGSGTWTLGTGTTLQLNSVTFSVHFATINCYNLYITGSSYWNGQVYDYVYISGNFSLTGTSYMNNPPDWNYFYFVGPSSPSSPQLCNVSTTTSGSYSYLYVNSGAYVQLSANSGWSQGDPFTVTTGGTFDCAGYTWGGNQAFNLNSGATLYVGLAGGINGALTTTGTKTLSASASYGFDGSTAQVTGTLLPATISSPGQLIINNSSGSGGVTLSQATTITTSPVALNLTYGILNTGGYTFTVPGASGEVTGAGTGSYVNGALTKTITGASVVNYEIGDADYAPMQLTFSSAGTAGSLSVKSTNGLHPAATSSGFGTSNMVNHYWTITNSGAAGPTTVTPMATYNSGDILGGSNSSFYTQEYAGGAWLGSPLASTNTVSPYTTTPNSGIQLSSLAGDYIFGATVPYAYATPASLSYGIVGIGSSAVLSTTLAGGNLLAGPLTVTAPANFQVSANPGGPWTSSITMPYTPPALGATALYIQFNPTSFTTYTDNVTVTGGGISSPYYIAVTGIGQPPCSGTPTAGSATSFPTSGNGGTSFTLSLTGSSVAAGLTYQWQSSTNNVTWSNIYGATNNTFNFTGLTGNTYFQCVVSCGTFSASSSSTLITSTGAAPSSCTPSSYFSSCTYYAGTSGNPVIINGVSGSISDASPCGSGTGGSPYYYNNTSMSVTFNQGGSYSSTIGSGYYYTSGQVWIDFNDDGVFQQSETIGGYQKANCCTTSPRQTPTLTIPVNATPGTHRMRVVNGYTLYYAPGYSSYYPSYPKMNPCPNTTSTQYYMDTRDYTAVINLAPASLTTSAASLNFGNVTTGTSAIPPQYFVLTGTNLSVSPVTVTPPANFAVSLDGVTWYTSAMTVGYTPGYPVGSMASTNIYVQFTPTTSGSYSGNITLSGGNTLTSTVVAVSGTGTPACSGTPTAGAASISPTTGNGATTFTLSLPSLSSSGGVIYQWQSSPTGTVWTNIQGGVFPTYTFSGLSASMQYRCIVTCVASGISSTSATAAATFTGGVATSSCTPSSYFSPCTYYVGTTGKPVMINGASGTSISDASACGSGTGGSSYYYNNVSMSVTFNQGGSYTSTIGSGYYYNSGQIWIDFNDNGIFEQTETVGGYNQPVCCTIGARATPTISIPANAVPGAHRMRVINGYSSLYGPGYSTTYPTYPQMNPCPNTSGTVYYADTRDYTAVIALPACSGTPLAGIVSVAGQTTGCNPYSTNIINVGENLLAGMSYQWQSSSSPTSGFANIAGATNSVYSTTISTVGTVYYRQIVTCANSGLSAATPASPAIILNPLPTSITGSLAICNGSNATLASTPATGTWTSSNTAIAAIGSTTGVLSGVAVGNATVTYTLPTTCYTTATITVNPLPAAIAGSTVVCQGSATALSDAGSGTWTSSNTAIATVGSSSGIVTGVSGGNPVITYTLPTGCIMTTPFTVNPVAPITGSLSLCSGYGTTLSDSLPGGTWSSGNPAVAIIGSTTGTVTSYSAGLTVITYTLPSGCTATAILGVTSTPNAYAISGGGNICPGSGAHIYVSSSDIAVGYQLYRNGIATGGIVTGTGTPVDMGLQTLGGTYTVIADAGSPCAVTMIGSLTITVLPAPTAYNLTGGGGYCTGGTGVHVGLDGSNVGFNYQLYNGTSVVGSPVPGTGTLVDFGLESAVGTYTVTATNTTTGCTGGMTGNAVVSINPPPTAYTMTGGGGYCVGGSGVAIGLSNSASGVNYQLYNGTTPAGSVVAGTGSSISFGLQTAAGTYKVVGTNTSTGCTGNMSGTKTVTVNPLPTAYGITGGGSYCAGGMGVHIGLSGSNSGVTYTLYVGGVSAGITASGTGGAIDFGLVTVPGIYTAVANNTSTGCTNNMIGSVTVATNALPASFSVTGGGTYCAGGTGVHIGLGGSMLGTNYILYRGTTVVSGGSGTTAPIDFGLETVAGVYTVVGTDPSTGCSTTMSGSATVVVNLLPNSYNMTGGGAYCSGGTGVPVGLNSSDGTVTYKLYNSGTYTGTSVLGTGVALSLGTFSAPGSYTMTATDNITGCTATMSGSSVVSINPLPTVYTVTGGGGYCTGGTGVHVGLSGSDVGVKYQKIIGVAPTGSPLSGTGSALDYGLQTTAGSYTIVATNTATGCVNNMAGSANVSINALPTAFNVTGGGNYCFGGSGVPVQLSNSSLGANYQLYLGTAAVGSSVAGTGSSLNFGLQTMGGTYTVVATDAVTGCRNTMSGSAVINVNPLPATFSVTGGGSYCTGGTGLHVGLSSSATGMTYQLYNGTSTVGSSVAGSGLAIDFGSQTAAGTYTVIATNTGTTCTKNMTGSAAITVNPLPSAFSVTGGGAYCAGGTGTHVGLFTSVTGVQYQLYNGTSAIGSPISGTGSALDFGPQTMAATYTVTGTSTSTGCSNNMTGSAAVAVNPLPVLHTVTGGGNYCIGGTGLPVGLNGTNTGINYQLYLGTTAVGSPMTGSGPAISFGLQTASGTYTVQATNTITGCASAMSGSAAVAASATPTVYSVTGGGTYCPSGTGVVVGLGSSDPGISYQLYHGTAIGAPVAGTGAAISFGPQTLSGTYTIIGTGTPTTCVATMSGSATVSIGSLPTAHNVTGGGNFCYGGTGMNVGLDMADAGVTYQLYNGAAVGAPVSGTGAPLSFGLQTASGSYTVIATNTTGCTNAMTGSVGVVVNALPTVYGVTGGGTFCVGTTGAHVTLAGSDPGVAYQLYNGTTTSGPAVPGTGSVLDFGAQPTGVYTVSATNATTHCASNMSGASTVVANPLPAPYTVTGGGGYCAGSPGADVQLSGSASGINYQLYNGTAAIGSVVAGTGTSIDFGMEAMSGTYTVQATDATSGCTNTMTGGATVVANPLPAVYTVSGSSPAYCLGGAGVVISVTGSDAGVNYQLYYNGTVSGSAIAGSGGSLSFGAHTSVGSYTVVASNASTGCSSNMAGTANVAVNAVPAVFSVTGGGAYCSGGTGVHVKLASSAPGITYQLYNGTTAMGSPETGTGSMLDFGLQTSAGSYTAVATDPATGCTSNMSGSASVGVNPAPAAYAVIGGGSYCAGGSGVNVGLMNSVTGVKYQLELGVTPVGGLVSGTGTAINFGHQTATGIYKVVATDAVTGCGTDMTGTATVAVNASPAIYSVTGGGSYCSGGAGVHVDLSNSTTGVSYQLYKSGSPSGTAMLGTGSSIDFGLQTSAGSYTVVATDTLAGCNSSMAGSATVNINASPAAFPVVGGGSYCAGGTGVHIGLGSSASGVTYTLRSGTTSSVMTGTGTAIDFGLQSVAGTYTVTGANTLTGCTNSMTGTATVAISAVVTPAVAITGGAQGCNGRMSTFTAAPTNGGVSPAYIWKVNGSVTGTGASTLSYLPHDGDVVSVTMTSHAACATPSTASTNTTMTVTSLEHPEVSMASDHGTEVCQGASVTLTAVPSYGGTAPVYTWVKNGVVDTTNVLNIYTYAPANGDNVYCIMHSNYYCRLADTGLSNTLHITTDVPQTPVVTVTATNGGAVTAGTQVVLTANVTNAGPSPLYQWYVNGTAVPGATLPVYASSTLSDQDVVACTVTSDGPCAGLQGTGSIAIHEVNVGVKPVSVNAIDVKVVPNPNKGVFTVKGSIGVATDAEVTLEITDMLGQVIYSGKVLAHNGDINEPIQLNNVANGMYILNVHAENGSNVFHIVVEQ